MQFIIAISKIFIQLIFNILHYRLGLKSTVDVVVKKMVWIKFVHKD